MIINIIIFILLLVGVFQLQVFLSKKPSKWVGLILPMICVCYSLIAVLIMSVSITSSKETTITEDGKVIERVIEDSEKEQNEGNLGNITLIFLMANVPTVILLTVYAGCRSEIKKKNGNSKELEKMNIIDLE